MCCNVLEKILLWLSIKIFISFNTNENKVKHWPTHKNFLSIISKNKRKSGKGLKYPAQYVLKKFIANLFLFALI